MTRNPHATIESRLVEAGQAARRAMESDADAYQHGRIVSAIYATRRSAAPAAAPRWTLHAAGALACAAIVLVVSSILVTPPTPAPAGPDLPQLTRALEESRRLIAAVDEPYRREAEAILSDTRQFALALRDRIPDLPGSR